MMYLFFCMIVIIGVGIGIGVVCVCCFVCCGDCVVLIGCC